MAAALGSAVLLSAAPFPASAQGNDRSTTKPEKLGLQIETGLDLLYDDNVFRVDDRAEKPSDDIIVTPSLQLTYAHPVGRHDVLLRAKAGYDWFLSHQERSKLRLDGEALANIRFGATCVLTPRAQYRQQRADYGDINQNTENLQRFTTLGADLSCARPGLFPVAGYEHAMTRNADRFDYADQTSDSFYAGVGYSKPSLGTITAYYEHTSSDRDNLGITNRINAYALRFQRSVSPLTQIDAQVAWLDVKSDSSVVGGYDGLGWDVKLTSAFIPRLKLSVSTERNIVNDSLIASGFAIRSNYRVEGYYALSELTSIGLYADWERRKFRQDAALRPFNISADRNRRFGAAVKRKLTDRADLTLDAQHYRRRTDTSASNYSGTQVTLSALLRF
ncbi:hypothetical protein [Sphingobium cloacae]|uniref:Gellan polysaccharide biosynthesis protein GelF n=1 Tax=Sphingobium cloacae TaxID=120107 RepID=A0A1E1EZ93_9SPHN|nr:hypothetical protein [Sphingobium cloacae]BAV63573.1 hypothetical protein SCLO_1005330 [Sphingobium cloacae]